MNEEERLKKLREELRKIKLTNRELADIIKFHKPENGMKLDTLEGIDEGERDYQFAISLRELMELAIEQRESTQKSSDLLEYTRGELNDCALEYARELVNDYDFNPESIIATYNEYVRLYNLKPKGEVLEKYLKLPEKQEKSPTPKMDMFFLKAAVELSKFHSENET